MQQTSEVASLTNLHQAASVSLRGIIEEIKIGWKRLASSGSYHAGNRSIKAGKLLEDLNISYKSKYMATKSPQAIVSYAGSLFIGLG